MFWNKASHTPKESETVREAREQLAAGEAGEALGTLTRAFTEQPEDRAAYLLAAEAVAALGGDEEAELFRRAAQSEPLQALFDLGMHFAEANHVPLTRAFLGRAFELSRHPVAAVKLAELERQNFQIEAAADLLRRAEPPLPYWAQAELARTELMLSRPDAARQLLHEYSLLDADEQQTYADLTERVRGILARWEAVGTPEQTVRDWHFIQYGGAILSFMGDAEGEGAAEVAGGRYVYQSGGASEVRRVLHKLRRLLAELGQRPPAVWACPDRDSEVLGRAAAALLGVPFLEGQRPLGDVLVVAADNRALLQGQQDIQELATVQRGQVVFAYNMNWVDAGGLTPDVAGLLSQMYVFPWAGGQMRVNTDDPEHPRVETTESDERPAAAIAAELLEAELDEAEADADFADVLAFYRRVRDLLRLNQPGATRWPFLRESPVPGSYFSFDGMQLAEAE